MILAVENYQIFCDNMNAECLLLFLCIFSVAKNLCSCQQCLNGERGHFNALSKIYCIKQHSDFFLSFFRENKTCHLIPILCLGEDSQEISSLIFSGKYKKIQNVVCCS